MTPKLFMFLIITNYGVWSVISIAAVAAAQREIRGIHRYVPTFCSNAQTQINWWQSLIRWLTVRFYSIIAFIRKLFDIDRQPNRSDRLADRGLHTALCNRLCIHKKKFIFRKIIRILISVADFPDIQTNHTQPHIHAGMRYHWYRQEITHVGAKIFESSFLLVAGGARPTFNATALSLLAGCWFYSFLWVSLLENWRAVMWWARDRVTVININRNP